MKSEFMAVQLVDLHNDTGFAKLASFAAEGALTEDELNVCRLSSPSYNHSWFCCRFRLLFNRTNGIALQ